MKFNTAALRLALLILLVLIEKLNSGHDRVVRRDKHVTRRGILMDSDYAVAEVKKGRNSNKLVSSLKKYGNEQVYEEMQGHCSSAPE